MEVSSFKSKAPIITNKFVSTKRSKGSGHNKCTRTEPTLCRGGGRGERGGGGGWATQDTTYHHYHHHHLFYLYTGKHQANIQIKLNTYTDEPNGQNLLA